MCQHIQLEWVEASHLEPETKSSDPTAYEAAWTRLRAADGIIVPGGFGTRGVEGMMLAAHYARTHRVPYFGICLGMQVGCTHTHTHTYTHTPAYSLTTSLQCRHLRGLEARVCVCVCVCVYSAFLLGVS